jgi:predicted acylesterase/phospholipase RssA
LLYSLREAALLGQHDALASGKDALALVLSGGGVKAAYQTAIIDGAYGIEPGAEPLLTNIGSADSCPNAPLRVRWITGNSGGALLGAFVATLGCDSIERLKTNRTTLTNVIWRSRPDTVKPTLERAAAFVPTTDILPFFDLMRWLSLLVGGLLFAVVLRVGRQRSEMITCSKHDTLSRKIRLNGLLRSLIWVVLLMAAPYVVIWYTGALAEEHVPYIQGVVYFYCLLIAIADDQSRHPQLAALHAAPNHGGLRLSLGRLATAIALLELSILGFLAVPRLSGHELYDRAKSLPAPLSWFAGLRYPMYEQELPDGAVIGSVALLLLFLSVHLFLGIYRSTPRLRRAEWWRGYARVAMFAAVPVIVLQLYYLYHRLSGHVPVLELSKDFWIRWCVIVLLVAVAIRVALWVIVRSGATYARIKPDRRSVLQSMTLVIAHSYRDLRTRQDARIFWLPRYGRILAFLSVGWVWWNLVVAPGLYGNGPARSYLAKRFRDLVNVEALQQTDQGSRKEIAAQLRLRAGFIVPTVSLDEQAPRYFEFRADDGPTSRPDDAPLERRPERWEIWPSPAVIARTGEFFETTDGQPALAPDCLRPVFDAVIASGSPFPMFPPHKVNNPFCKVDAALSQKVGLITSLEDGKLLVDGGFAHNIPIGAARVVGARQVLVLESSVRGSDEGQTGPISRGVFGNLATNVGRVVPFLWENAQASDLQRNEDLFVLHAAPEVPAQTWPFLGDFRSSSIQACTECGQRDVEDNRRIVTINSPGRAIFRRLPAPETMIDRAMAKVALAGRWLWPGRESAVSSPSAVR